MNKNVKRIITFALVLSTVSAVTPAVNINLFATRAYAATTNTTDALNSLKLQSSGGSNIKLYDDDTYSNKDKVDNSKVTKGSTYYARTDYRTVSIDADGPSSSYIKVFKGTSGSTKGKSISSNITLDDLSTTLVIRVYSEVPDSNIRYDAKDNVLSEYRIKVKRTDGSSSSSDTDASQYDDIYLDRLSVNGNSISLSESKISYTYSVPNNMSSVTIKAEPQSSRDVVRIDGSKVYEDEGYKRIVSLSTGDTEIKIETEDEDNNDNRIYTLKITREGTNTSYGNLSNTTYKRNQWIQVNTNWKYIDETGEPKKNVFFTDPVNWKTYYLQYNGFMATEWNKIGGYWYYFGVNGAMQTGWVKSNGNWYYLDWSGIMKTGWIFDGSNYYYLYSDGSMAVNAQIGSYYVGADGAWRG